jgi:S-ribosylhomocysteine lyase LuxS involved in autoinducer biosynthesis
VLKAFKQKHDGIVPPSVKHGFTVDTWKEAVRANDIKLFAAAKHVPLVKQLHTIEEKIRKISRTATTEASDQLVHGMDKDRSRSRQDSKFGKDETRVDSPKR